MRRTTRTNFKNSISVKLKSQEQDKDQSLDLQKLDVKNNKYFKQKTEDESDFIETDSDSSEFGSRRKRGNKRNKTNKTKADPMKRQRKLKVESNVENTHKDGKTSFSIISRELALGPSEQSYEEIRRVKTKAKIHKKEGESIKTQKIEQTILKEPIAKEEIIKSPKSQEENISETQSNSIQSNQKKQQKSDDQSLDLIKKLKRFFTKGKYNDFCPFHVVGVKFAEINQDSEDKNDDDDLCYVFEPKFIREEHQDDLQGLNRFQLTKSQVAEFHPLFIELLAFYSNRVDELVGYSFFR